MEAQPKTPFETTLANIIDLPELWPEVIKAAMTELASLRPVLQQVEQSITQTRESLSKLYDQKTQLGGSFDMALKIIERSIPQELLDKYGKELTVKNPATQA